LRPIHDLSEFEQRVFASLVFGVVGDAMGSATELLEPDEIERRFGWVETFEGDGTDDVIMRDLLAGALVETAGYATADDWAAQWVKHSSMIFGEKANRFFPSILHAAEKLRRGYLPRVIAKGTMPTTTSAMAIAPVGIVNAGHPVAAAAQAAEIASLVHIGEEAFCQDGAVAIAAAIARALSPGATVEAVLETAIDCIKPWSGAEMRSLIGGALKLAKSSADFMTFRRSYHEQFRRAVICDSRETVPASLAIVWLAAGDPWKAIVFSANFGRDTDTIGCMAGGICGALSGLTPENSGRFENLPEKTVQAQLTLARALARVRYAKAKNEAEKWS
jgi:ADP-ribosylglycohydrolase